jgi:hypothetical protein
MDRAFAPLQNLHGRQACCCVQWGRGVLQAADAHFKGFSIIHGNSEKLPVCRERPVAHLAGRWLAVPLLCTTGATGEVKTPPRPHPVSEPMGGGGDMQLSALFAPSPPESPRRIRAQGGVKAPLLSIATAWDGVYQKTRGQQCRRWDGPGQESRKGLHVWGQPAKPSQEG